MHIRGSEIRGNRKMISYKCVDPAWWGGRNEVSWGDRNHIAHWVKVPDSVPFCLINCTGKSVDQLNRMMWFSSTIVSQKETEDRPLTHLGRHVTHPESQSPRVQNPCDWDTRKRKLRWIAPNNEGNVFICVNEITGSIVMFVPQDNERLTGNFSFGILNLGFCPDCRSYAWSVFIVFISCRCVAPVSSHARLLLPIETGGGHLHQLMLL